MTTPRTGRWPPIRPLTFKPPLKPRLTSLREFEVNKGNTIIAIFQGTKGANPQLDIIVKYRERGRSLRTPRHIHWAIDLLIKKEHEQALTNELIGYLIQIYDRVQPLRSRRDRARRALISANTATQAPFERLNLYGDYSVEMTCRILELLAIQEKTGNPDAFMFRAVLERILKDQDIFSIVSAAVQRRRDS